MSDNYVDEDVDVVGVEQLVAVLVQEHVHNHLRDKFDNLAYKQHSILSGNYLARCIIREIHATSYIKILLYVLRHILIFTLCTELVIGKSLLALLPPSSFGFILVRMSVGSSSRFSKSKIFSVHT